jgi:hypothetical protein
MYVLPNTEGASYYAIMMILTTTDGTTITEGGVDSSALQAACILLHIKP